MNEKVVNLTSHEITIVGEDGMEVVIPPSGKEARIRASQKEVGTVILRGDRDNEDNDLAVPIVKTELGEVEGFEFPHPCLNCELIGSLCLDCEIAGNCPYVDDSIKECERQMPKQYYIVSSMVAQKLKRADVIAPDTTPAGVVKDEKGRIIGVKRFQRW